MSKCINKVIVFDLDDTIGHFEQVSMFLNGLQLIVDKKISDKFLYKLLDLWPQFLRPGIIDILETIAKAKKRNKCVKAVIYTNNMGNRSWTLIIKRYLERKIGSKIFDKVITAYRPHEKHNCRTTHSKTYSDLLKCTKYNKDTQFLFLDDQYHIGMRHSNIKYIHLHPYTYSVPYKQMITSFLNSKYSKIVKHKYNDRFKTYMFKYLTSGSGYNKYNLKKNKISKKDVEQMRLIKKSVKQFLNIHNTRHRRKRKTKNKTRKEY